MKSITKTPGRPPRDRRPPARFPRPSAQGCPPAPPPRVARPPDHQPCPPARPARLEALKQELRTGPQAPAVFASSGWAGAVGRASLDGWVGVQTWAGGGGQAWRGGWTAGNVIEQRRGQDQQDEGQLAARGVRRRARGLWSAARCSRARSWRRFRGAGSFRVHTCRGGRDSAPVACESGLASSASCRHPARSSWRITRATPTSSRSAVSFRRSSRRDTTCASGRCSARWRARARRSSSTATTSAPGTGAWARSRRRSVPGRR